MEINIHCAVKTYMQYDKINYKMNYYIVNGVISWTNILKKQKQCIEDALQVKWKKQSHGT